MTQHKRCGTADVICVVMRARSGDIEFATYLDGSGPLRLRDCLIRKWI